MPKAKNRGPQTQAKRKYNEKNYETISIFVKTGYKSVIKNHAENRNMSVNEYIKGMILKELRAEGEEIDEKNF